MEAYSSWKKRKAPCCVSSATRGVGLNWHELCSSEGRMLAHSIKDFLARLVRLALDESGDSNGEISTFLA